MKKILLSISIILSTVMGYTQQPNYSPTGYSGKWFKGWGYISSDSGFFSLFKDTALKPLSGYWDIKFIGVVPYYWDGTGYRSFAGGGGVVNSVSGTTNRITSTGGATPVIDIANTYVGQSSITTLGTISTGTWNGTTIAVANGGTGQTTLTANKVLVGNGSSILSPTNFHWDNTNTRLGIGNASPQVTLDITGTIRKIADANVILKPATSVNAPYGIEFQRALSTPQIAAFTVNEGSGLISIGSQDVNYFTRIRSGNADIINITTGGNIGIRTITSPTAYFHLPAGTATASSAPFKFTAGAILTTAESGVLETDGGNNIFYTNATAVRGRLQQNRTLTSAAGTLSITDNYNHYVFTGSTSTWTLPPVSGTANVIYYIKNRGSGVLTINTTSGNEIYETAAVATINVSAGAALVLFSDGTYYNVE